MDVLLLIPGFLLIIIGLVGCIVPIIPGPPLSYLGLLLMHFTSSVQFSQKFLLLWAALVVGVTLIDYFTPIWGTRKFGGTRRGTWGATIGLLLGLVFFPPLGIIIGPFAGAVIGELTQSEDMKKAIRSGMGSLLGFMIGTGLKFVVSGFITYYFFRELFSIIF
jgi:uncharacterized protein YqgC (DUF456 family)